MKRRTTGLVAVFACLLLLCLVMAGGASAAITATDVTAPVDGSYFVQESPGAHDEVKTVVEGTIESEGAPGSIEILCYSGTESEEVETLEEGELQKVSVGKYEFSVKVPVEEFGESPCVLRAVPEGAPTLLPPGTVTPFKGPRVAYSEMSLMSNKADTATIGYELEARTFPTTFEIESAGQCGLGPTALLSSPALAPSNSLFECAGALYGLPVGASRADIKVDGRNAYDPYAANSLLTSLKPAGLVPSIDVNRTFDSETGLTTVHETDPLVECKGSKVAYPETSESCEELISAGVSLERTWTPTNEGRLITMSDVWRSTDNGEHSVSALYQQELDSDVTSPGTYEFPVSEASFAATKSGESIELPAGGGTILYRDSGAASEAAGDAYPVGAVILSTTPSEAVQATAGSAENNGSSSLAMPYSFSVKPATPATLTMAYAQGYTIAEVCALAETAESKCPVPAFKRTEPETKETPTTSTSTSTTPTVTTTTGTSTPASGSSSPTAHRTATAKVVKGAVVISVSCSGSVGKSCVVKATLTTVEKLRDGKASALAARTRTVTVGSISVSIPAGTTRTITIRLNATGRALLARFHKLPTHLSALQSGVTGPHASVASQTLAILPRHH